MDGKEEAARGREEMSDDVVLVKHGRGGACGGSGSEKEETRRHRSRIRRRERENRSRGREDLGERKQMSVQSENKYI